MRPCARFVSAALLVALLGSQASAQLFRPFQGPCAPCEPLAPLPGRAAPETTTPTTPLLPGQQQQPEPGQGQAPGSEAFNDTNNFAQSAGEGTAAEGGFNPTMFGDAGPTSFVGTTATTATPTATPATHTTTPTTSTTPRSLVAPLIARGTFKISENESPRPMDRVFFNYNYFNDVRTASTAGGPPLNINRETLGFEKTFLSGNASFGIRQPILQMNGDGSFDQRGLGDLTMISKWAPINNRQTGNVLSGGLVVTAPTGNKSLVSLGTGIHPTLLQPYLGYIYNWQRFYLMGFDAFVASTDSRDASLIFHDMALGYWLYRNSASQTGLTGIVPTFEAHVIAPTSHAGLANLSFGSVGIPDIVTLTSGATFFFNNRMGIGAAFVQPVTGPIPFNGELIVRVNYRF